MGVSSVAIQDYKGNTFNHYSLESRIATWSQMLSTLFFFFLTVNCIFIGHDCFVILNMTSLEQKKIFTNAALSGGSPVP